MILNEDIKNQIRNHIKLDSESECCGLIYINKGRKIKVFPCRNDIKTNREIAAIINPFDYLQVAQLGTIIAFYHSHPSGNPEFSIVDKLTAENQQLELILYCPNTDSFFQYTPQGYDYKYVGKEFKIGTNDCFSLVQEYYKSELHIDIIDTPRDENWYEKTPKLIEEHAKINQFTQVTDFKINDVVSFFFYDDINPSHLGIYVEENCILHHPRNGYSIVEGIGISLKSRIGPIYRHANFRTN